MTLAAIEAALKAAGIAEARTEALILAEHFTGKIRAALLASPDAELDGGAKTALSPTHADARSGVPAASLAEAVERRVLREPLTYITGVAYFMNEEYEVSPACLVPRRETETLVEEAARAVGEKNAAVLDVCSGSGCVAISLAALAPHARVRAIEISEAAIAIAVRNAARNGTSDRVTFECADMFAWTTESKFDVITANPPYIAAGEMRALDPELSFEPSAALTDGGDGLSFLRELCQRYASFLSPGGVLLCEIGSSQGAAALEIARRAGLRAEIVCDLSGRDRVLKSAL